VIAAIGGGGPPGMEIQAGRVAILASVGRICQIFDLPRRAPVYEREGFRDLSRLGEVSCASMWAIHAWLYLHASVVVGPAAVTEGMTVEGHHIAFHPRRCLLGLGASGHD